MLLITTSVHAEVITYYHHDALGSTVAATDESGALLWKEAYRPYGERIRKEDADTSDIWYTGKPHEEEMGLSYFGARWYDPAIGRFMAIDPVGVDEANIHSFNRYAYANNNPYKFVDPDGRNPVAALFFLGKVAFEGGKVLVRKVVTKFAKKEAGKKVVTKGQTFQRVMSNAELKATQESGLLRGGRPGENFFTNNASLDAKRAQQRLGLDGPLRDSRVEFRIKNNIEVTGPRPAKPGQTGTPGGGREFSTNGRTEIEILRIDPLRK